MVTSTTSLGRRNAVDCSDDEDEELPVSGDERVKFDLLFHVFS